MKSLRKAYQKIFMPSDPTNASFEERLAEVEQHELAQIPVVCEMVRSVRDSLAENRRGICKFGQGSRSRGTIL
ncbi:hypothetical protein SAY87_027045 [Trapa incisa]|uniref:Uncharacterized protein n=1 Tax=Trapa incisa TaxID=236973 RepID=A0AAN7GR67_9MYRT|nr:hypothetical protein SAY87_027045 [Trapa incisa]